MIWDAAIPVSFPERMDILSPEMMAGDAFFFVMAFDSSNLAGEKAFFFVFQAVVVLREALINS